MRISRSDAFLARTQGPSVVWNTTHNLAGYFGFSCKTGCSAPRFAAVWSPHSRTESAEHRTVRQAILL